ncbi:bifunctional hydroxymethylpyrimidine kinase/phosphomethylpyrimidine kinase [uncultured Sphingomonas sp.]|uniref:bifunctional hydroxymethylpyrimidine kinase/phosphomethylpyrimidine kinase n=1 Tax=uncultured Sphingomonas sp. TaxID=158754 RepID=UPI002619537E|nr:bifunctional hydroxymethylpyrimidine kinase/phosphomethylpyrimidine kinase [uncultured Sphingomonas sp.]
MTPRVLIVAGSDSGGGAGIQADIRTVTMLGGHPMTAITALTAQNTLGVEAVHAVPPAFVVGQMACVAGDIGVDAVKIGMLGGGETVDAIVDELSSGCYGVPIVFDPVMVATSGSVLADERTIAGMARLARRATVITPNLPELAALTGGDVSSHDAAAMAATEYARASGVAVLVKGGHAEGDTIVDRLVGRDGEIACWSAPRIDTKHSHGTGCTLASAIAEGLGRGMTLPDAISRARLFVRIALREAPGFGAGHGPMGHQRVRLDADLGGMLPNQITLPATDHAASLAFYRALGLVPIVDSEARYARFESAGGTTLSIEAAGEIGHRAIVFLEVADMDATVAAARARGITVAEPIDQPWGWREARLADPAGNPLCLYTAGENRRFPPWRLPCPD